MDTKKQVVNIFPLAIREDLRNVSFQGLEEIRVRMGLPVELIYDNRVCWLRENMETKEAQWARSDKVAIEKNYLMKKEKTKVHIDRIFLEEMLNYMTGYSYYAMEEELKKGYLTLQGGHRIGLTGRTNYQGSENNGSGQVTGLTDIGGLNIRIAHERKGCAKRIVEAVRDGSLIHNTLIFAAPGIGKTTYLRDAIRILSWGDKKYEGLKICVIDERSEIGACCHGKPQNDLGGRTDVLDACPKEIGMEMVLRSMSPQVIAVDELGKESEFQMLQKMRRSGVKVLGTMHGGDMEELTNIYGQQMLACFERFVELRRMPDGGRGFCIYDKYRNQIC